MAKTKKSLLKTKESKTKNVLKKTQRGCGKAKNATKKSNEPVVVQGW